MIPIRRTIPKFLLLCAALLLSGCVWLRLLDLKGQLAEFDQNVRVEVANQHFILHLLHPVLLSEDFPALTKLNPSRIEKLPQGERWFLAFRNDPAAKPQAAKTLSFALTFNAEQRLAAFDFSPLFLEMAPPAFLEASIRSLGLGKVDRDKQQLKVDPEDLPKLAAKLPNRQAILAVLGPPAVEFAADGLKVLYYQFRAEAIPIDPEYDKRRQADVKLYFDPAKDELVRLAGRFAGLKLAIDYRRLLSTPAK